MLSAFWIDSQSTHVDYQTFCNYNIRVAINSDSSAVCIHDGSVPILHCILIYVDELDCVERTFEQDILFMVLIQLYWNFQMPSYGHHISISHMVKMYAFV